MRKVEIVYAGKQDIFIILSGEIIKPSEIGTADKVYRHEIPDQGEVVLEIEVKGAIGSSLSINVYNINNELQNNCSLAFQSSSDFYRKKIIIGESTIVVNTSTQSAVPNNPTNKVNTGNVYKNLTPDNIVSQKGNTVDSGNLIQNDSTVKFFNEAKGFGFISPPDGSQEVFVQFSGLKDEIGENDRASFDMQKGTKGLAEVIGTTNTEKSERIIDNQISDGLIINKPREETNHSVNVFYATDRNSITIGDNVSFGNNRGNKTSYGICKVSLPSGKKIGEIPRPHWWKLEFKEDINRHVVISKMESLDPDSFFNTVETNIANSVDKDAFIFIHGYNVTFEDAARRTAQMAFDLSFKGAPVMYSWASKGTLEGYIDDIDNTRFSKENLIRFLKEIRVKTNAEKIHLIAHSMGNLALTDALIQLEGQNLILFNQIILAAPDIDAEIFVKDIAPKIKGYSDRVTLYASSKDKALKFARKLRFTKTPRAGDSGKKIICVEGIDTIDASNVYSDFFGHSNFGDAKELIEDIFQLLSYNHPPQGRNLQEKVIGFKKYWTFRK